MRTHLGSPLLLVALVLAGCGGVASQEGSPGDMASAPGTGSGPNASSIDAAQAPSPPDLGMHADLAVVPDGAVTVTSDDGFGAARTACINEINKLRATQNLTAYTLVNTDSINMCVDAQAASDEQSMQAHAAWIAAEGSACDGNGQDECEGYGTDAAGIVACLDAMWAEKDQPNCAGCVGCTQFGGACANCDFYGTSGSECGHYVNMSAVYFTQVACGFSTGSWAAQNFYQ